MDTFSISVHVKTHYTPTPTIRYIKVGSVNLDKYFRIIKYSKMNFIITDISIFFYKSNLHMINPLSYIMAIHINIESYLLNHDAHCLS